MYVGERFGYEYGVVDSLLEDKKITANYINYLFKPGDIIVEAMGQKYTEYIAESWVIDGRHDSKSQDPQKAAKMSHPLSITPPKYQRYSRSSQRLKKLKGKEPTSKITKTLKAWTFVFDGGFRPSYKTLEIEVPHGKPTTTMKPEEDDAYRGTVEEAQPICSLNVFPLKYAPDSVLNLLKQRGNTFWKCRSRRLVSYHGKRSGGGIDMVSTH